MNINWNEASTKRNAVRVITALVASVFLWFGKDAQQVLTIGTFVAGGLGMALPDKAE